ncbi:uncharacterized protein [Halyomorpha halys]|uniref:uncharacterized protein n=1 Tax=Halyomorpha halys TaxID=286706 RepID=UPI0034D19265|nr:Gustatory receptor 84 [Halyomorpha halys]
MMEKKSISAAMKPLLRLSRIFGLHLILRKELATSLLFAYSLSIFSLLGYAAFGVILWLQNVDYHLYDSLMHISIEKAQKGFLYFNYMTIFGATIYYNKPFNKIITDFEKVDKCLVQIGMPITYKMDSIIVTCIAKFLSLAILVVLDYFLSSDTHWLFTVCDLVATHGPLMPIFIYELHFFAIMTYISQHFRFIKVKLEETIVNIAFENQLTKIYELIRIYDDLRTMSTELNKVVSIPILITVASIFCLGIVNVHLIGIAGSYQRDLLLTFLIGYLLLRMYELWTILQPFVITTKEVNLFNAVLFRFMILDRTGVFTKDEKLYLHLVMKKGICFTAWEFFNLDYTLIQSVVGASSTILVILIQYSLSKRELWCEET